MNRNHAQGFQQRGMPGRGLLGEGPRMGGQGQAQMEPVSLGMKRMTGGLLGSAPQQQPRSLMEQGNTGQVNTGRNMMERPNYRGAQDPHAERRGFGNEQGMRGYAGEEIQDPQPERRGFMNKQEMRAYPHEETQSRRALLEQPAMRRGMLERGSMIEDQRGGLLEQPEGQDQGYEEHSAGYYQDDQSQIGYMDDPQYRRRVSNEQASDQQRGQRFMSEQQADMRYRKDARMTGQQYVEMGYQEESEVRRGPRPERPAPMSGREDQLMRHPAIERQAPMTVRDDQPMRRGVMNERQAPMTVRDDQPMRRGVMNERQASMTVRDDQLIRRGPRNESQASMPRDDQPMRRALVNERSALSARNDQSMRRGILDEHSASLAIRDEQSIRRALVHEHAVRNDPSLRQGILDDHSTAMAVMEDQPVRRGILKRNDKVASMLERRDRQVELMEKAELQMQMIQEEERKKEELMKREMMERYKQQELVKQQQLMLQAQLQQQQARLPGDGLLGSGPSGHMQAGAHQMGRSIGEIPSLFDVPTKQIRTTLGKRPGGPGERRFNDKKSRFEPPDNRNRSNRRDGYEQRRSDNRRPSRFEQALQSKPRDRKDSDTKRKQDKPARTPDKPARTPDKSARTPEKAALTSTPKESPKVNLKDKKVKGEIDPKVKEETPKVDVKVKDNKMDVVGNTTQVTVTMGNDEYDPAEPTGDIIVIDGDEIDVSEAKPKVEKEPVSMETDENTTEKKDEDNKAEEDNKPMEISLMVTVNKKGRSVNDSDKAGENKSARREKKYKCNVCSIDCWDEESFSRHMNGMKHRKKMEVVMTSSTHGAVLLNARKQAEQHLRQIEGQRRGPKGKPLPVGKALESQCKVCNKKFTGSYKDHKEDPDHKEKSNEADEERRKAGCNVCKVDTFNSYSDLTKHWQSASHRKKSWPECKLCNQRFKSPRKFVQHCKTDHHIENKRRNQSSDDVGDEMEELVTLDTIGFEDDMAAEETTEESSLLTSTPKPFSSPQTKQPIDSPIPISKMEDVAEVPKEYDPNVAVGQHLVVAVSGFFCKMCNKFYNNEETARVIHCKSQRHYNKCKKAMVTWAYKQKLKDEKQTKSSETSLAENEGLDENQEVTSDDQMNDNEPEMGNQTGKETGNQAEESKMEQSEVEASAYETADEHKDTINITVSLDSEDATLDSAIKTEEDNVVEEGDGEIEKGDGGIEEGDGVVEEGDGGIDVGDGGVDVGDGGVEEENGDVEKDCAVEKEDVVVEEEDSVVKTEDSPKKVAGTRKTPQKATRGRKQTARRGRSKAVNSAQ